MPKDKIGVLNLQLQSIISAAEEELPRCAQCNAVEWEARLDQSIAAGEIVLTLHCRNCGAYVYSKLEAREILDNYAGLIESELQGLFNVAGVPEKKEEPAPPALERPRWKPYRVTVVCEVEGLHEGLARIMARSALRRGEYTITNVEEIEDVSDQES